MALSNFFEIKEWRSPDSDPDAAGLVGAEPIPRITATKIMAAADGELEFRDEVKIDVVRGLPLDLRAEPYHGSCPPQLLQTIMVKCPDGRCQSNQTVVVAAYPYSVDWFV